MAKNDIRDIVKGKKNPSLEEIENEEPVVTPDPDIQVFKLEDVIAKAPDEITAEEQDFLADNADDLTDEQKVAFGLMEPEDLGDEEKKEADEDAEDDKGKKDAGKKPEPPARGAGDKSGIEEESEEEKERKYKAQQAEAQIQSEKNKSITQKAEEAANIPDPTEDELKKFVAEDGATWDELTNFEQAQAKRTYLAEKRSKLVLEAVQEGNKVDEWAGKVDTFIESTDGKPEFVELSGNELEFRKYCMKEAHRGAPIDVLLPAFLHQLPPKKQNRGDLLLRGGGGERPAPSKDGIITDADQAAKLRLSNPREWQRLNKAGKIKIEI